MLRLPWHEWREDFGEDERCDYLANLLYRGAGLTVKDASVVPGGVRMAGRTVPDRTRRDASGDPSAGAASSHDSSSGASSYSGDDGMSGYVRRVVADPGSNVRINRSGSVIVEDNTLTDADARALRDSEYVPRVYSRDKRNPSAGYEDGGYDPARSEADEILRRVERRTRFESNGGDVLRSSADVAPYGMTLEPGARSSARRGAPRATRRRRGGAGGTDAPEPSGAEGGARAERAERAERVSRRAAPNRAASVRRRAPSASAAERAAGAAGAIRRRRVRVSVPKSASSRFAGTSRGAAKDASNDVAAATRAGPDDADGALLSSADSARANRRDAPVSDAPVSDAPVSSLRGVGSKSAARLKRMGVESVGDLAALSDARCAESAAAAEKGASVRGMRDKARRALGGAWEP